MSAHEIVIHDAVRERVYDHVFASLESEVGGVLLGPRNGDGPVAVTASVEALEADNQTASVTFTQESWAGIYEQMEKHHPGLSIVGWYHSHPGFGIFLSDYDLFIHRSFFSDERQVAYVVDPRRGREGWFGWHDGEVAAFGEAETRRRAAPLTESSGGESAERRRSAPLAAAGLVLGLLVGATGGMLIASDGRTPAATAEVQAPAPTTTPAPTPPAAPVADPRVRTLTAEVRGLKAELRGTRGRSHILKPGQTLSELADRYYGDARKAWLIAGVNGLDDLHRVPAGIRLLIPSPELAERSVR
jgi:proteasome lid subunit RPN8/RPN11